jgi:type 1 fimbria pilin
MEDLMLSASQSIGDHRCDRAKSVAVYRGWKRLVRIALTLLLIGLAPLTARAGLTCNTGNLNKVFAAGTIAIASNTPVGATAATLAPSAFQFSCRFLSTLSPGNDTSATLYADFKTAAPLVAGYSDVYQTGIAGLGVRYTLNSSECNASNVVLSNGSIRLNCPFAGNVDGPYMPANLTVTASLIMTSAIAPGASSLTSVPAVTIGFGTSDQGGYWSQNPLYTGSATGVLVHSTCSVNSSAVDVNLPQVNTGAFSSGVGAVAGAQAFSLSLTCSSGATVLITLTDAANPANRSTTLQLASGSSAQGVGVQLLNSGGTPAAYGADSATPGNTNQWTVGASPNGSLQIPMTARYVRTGAVSAGSVKALATFTMSYQ